MPFHKRHSGNSSMVTVVGGRLLFPRLNFRFTRFSEVRAQK
jgi:hypothetical protein